MSHSIIATIAHDTQFWVCFFECKEGENYRVAKQIFGKEPTDAEIYEFISLHYHELQFTQPVVKAAITIKRINFKRRQREVKRLMEKIPVGKQVTLAQQTLHANLEQHKKKRLKITRQEKEAVAQRKFDLKQAKRKQKHRGH